MYYPNGWKAYIDGQLTDHFKVDYVLRAMRVPEGNHTIEFKFVPEVVEQGSKITLASTILLGLVLLGGIGYSFWRTKKEETS
ncbi:YfhO family protein [Maribacter litopenaei]|uniref:YfhO family protein n=1 Tax=Maribacter litopenaei TaxID=2976127 RepID=UPI003B84AE56